MKEEKKMMEDLGLELGLPNSLPTSENILNLLTEKQFSVHKKTIFKEQLPNRLIISFASIAQMTIYELIIFRRVWLPLPHAIYRKHLSKVNRSFNYMQPRS